MKLVFVLPRFHTNLFYAIKALRMRGHEITMFVAERALLEDYSHVPSVVLGDRDLGWLDLLRRLRALSPDLIVIRHTDGAWKRFLWAGLLLRIPMLGYDQRPLYRRRSSFTRLREFLGGKPLTRFTAISGKRDASMQPDRDTHYLPFPVEAAPEAKLRTWAPQGVVRILCVGKLSQSRKRHFLLLEALEALPEPERFTLSFVGSTSTSVTGGESAYLDRLRRYLKDGKLAERTRILADVPFQDMAALYLAHDICVLPSRYEPLGTAPLEALAHGCVAVVSDDCGSAPYFRVGVNGFIFPADDCETLRRILDGLISNPDRLPALGTRAIRHASKEFGMNRFAERFATICREL